MHECTADYHLGLLELLCLLSLSVCHSSHVEHYHHWLTPRVSSSAIEGSAVISLLHSLLQQLGNDTFEDVGTMLGVYVRHIREDAVEVGGGLLLEVFAVEEI